MDNWMVAVIAVVSNLVISAVFYGRLIERVTANGGRLEKVEDAVADHSQRIGHVEGKLSFIQEKHLSQ